jgi:hypothetical protein
METISRDEVLEQLLADICHLSYKHEVQSWRDAPGTDAEKLAAVLKLARDGLAIVRGRLRPEDA